MKELNIKVNGMHCSGCENRIQNSLGNLDGVESVVANHNEGIVKITLNKDIEISEIKETIEDIGFEVEE